MLGTYLNVATVVIGTLVGVAMGARLKDNYKELTVQAIGVATMAMGAQMFVGAPDAIIGTTAIGCLIFGGLLGEFLRIEAGINALGEYAQKRLSKSEGNNFQQAFVTTSILFCVGPMTVLGCLQDGLRQGFQLLALKSILDGISSAFFAAALGWGVMLSAVTVLLVQASLTLAAGSLQGFGKTDPRLLAMTTVGGLMLIALGLRLLNLKPIRVANFLPGLFLAPLVMWTLIHFGWYPPK